MARPWIVGIHYNGYTCSGGRKLIYTSVFQGMVLGLCCSCILSSFQESGWKLNTVTIKDTHSLALGKWLLRYVWCPSESNAAVLLYHTWWGADRCVWGLDTTGVFYRKRQSNTSLQLWQQLEGNSHFIPHRGIISSSQSGLHAAFYVTSCYAQAAL